jgi:hypothetical protein
MGDADVRSGEVLVRKPDALEHRPGWRSVTPIRNEVTPVLGVECHTCLLKADIA